MICLVIKTIMKEPGLLCTHKIHDSWPQRTLECDPPQRKGEAHSLLHGTNIIQTMKDRV